MTGSSLLIRADEFTPGQGSPCYLGKYFTFAETDFEVKLLLLQGESVFFPFDRIRE